MREEYALPVPVASHGRPGPARHGKPAVRPRGASRRGVPSPPSFSSPSPVLGARRWSVPRGGRGRGPPGRRGDAVPPLLPACPPSRTAPPHGPPGVPPVVRPPRPPPRGVRDRAPGGGRDLPGHRGGGAVDDRGACGTVYGAADEPEVPVILLPRDPAPAAPGGARHGPRHPEARSRAGRCGCSRTACAGRSASTCSTAAMPRPPRFARDWPSRWPGWWPTRWCTPSPPRSRTPGDGLMSHSLNRNSLLGQRAAVDPQCAAAFLSRLAALPPAPRRRRPPPCAPRPCRRALTRGSGAR